MLPTKRLCLIAFGSALLFAVTTPRLRAQDEGKESGGEEAKPAAEAPAEAAVETPDPAPDKDDPALVELVARAVNGDYRAHKAALEELAAKHGATAVNPLLKWISSNADTDQRVRGVYCLRRLGHEATLAMVAGLHSQDAMTRRNLCMALADSGDAVSAPALAAVAECDVDPIAREKAAEALKKIGGADGHAVDQLTGLAQKMLAGDDAGLSGDALGRVFFWHQSRVAMRAIPPQLNGAAYAKVFAEDALRMDPGHAGARETLVKSYGALATGLGALVKGGGDGVPESAALWVNRLPKIQDLARLGGAMPPELKFEAKIPDSAKIGGADQLIGSSDKRLRYKAAITSAGKTAAPSVVETLGQAMSEDAVRHVLVVSQDVPELNAWVAGLKARDVFVTGASSGGEALVRAKTAPMKDAIIVRANIRDVAVDHMIANLTRDVRTKDTPVIVVADEADVARLTALFGSKVLAVVPAPATAAVLKPSLDAAFAKAALNDERMDAEQFAAFAAQALAQMDAASLAPAEGALVNAIGREDAVQIPALIAIAKLGPEGAEAPLVKMIADPATSAAARTAGTHALGGVLAKHPAHAGTIDALAKQFKGSTGELRSAAASALGSAVSLSTEERSKLLLDNSLAY